MNSIDLSIKSIFKKSFQEFKEYFWCYALIGLLRSLPSFEAFLYFNNPMQFKLIHTKIGYLHTSTSVSLGIIYFLLAFISMTIEYLLYVGLTYHVYKVKKNDFYSWKQCFEAFNFIILRRMLASYIFFGFLYFIIIVPPVLISAHLFYIKNIFLNILSGCIIGGAVILCWITITRYILWPFIIFEQKTAWQALKESYYRTKGHIFNIGLIELMALLIQTFISIGILKKIQFYFPEIILLITISFIITIVQTLFTAFSLLVLGEIYDRLTIVYKKRQIDEHN